MKGKEGINLRKKLYFFILFLTFFAIVITACSSDTVINNYDYLEGKAVYNNSEIGVENVKIYLDNDLKTNTNQHGEFYISGLEENSYTLKAVKKGFNDFEEVIFISDNNGILIRLDPIDDSTIISGNVDIINSGESLNNLLASSSNNNFTALSNANNLSSKKQYVEDEVIIKYNKSSDVSSQSFVAQNQGLKLAKSLSTSKGDLVKYKLAKGQNVEEVIKTLENQAGIEYAEPNYYAYAMANPNDTEYNEQWGLVTANLEAGWDVQNSSSSAVMIALLDSGILGHEDLDTDWYADGNNFVDGLNYGDPDGYDPTNDDITDKTSKSNNGSHATHIAGIIAAITNNNKGVAGVGWTNNYNIIPVKVLNSNQEGTYYDIAEGIYYSVDILEVDILNLSLGGTEASTFLEEAIEYASDNNKILVAAAGNSGDHGLLYPAAYPETISVGAVTFNNERAYYSNYSSKLDLVAPGGEIDSKEGGILSTWGYYDETNDRIYTNEYVYMEGTSMATAFVSGAAALLLENGIIPDNVKARLTTTAVDLGDEGKDYEYGYGLLDVYGALLNEKLEEPFVFAASKNGDELRIESDFTRRDRDGSYTLVDEVVGNYYIVGWRDVNDNSRIDVGDYFGMTDQTTNFNLKNYYKINLKMNYVDQNSTAASLSIKGAQILK